MQREGLLRTMLRYPAIVRDERGPVDCTPAVTAHWALDEAAHVLGEITGRPFDLPEGWQLLTGYLVGPGADLRGVDFADADLSGANLEGATGLKSGGLDGACGDRDTKLPKGLTIPMCREEENQLPPPRPPEW